MRLLLVLICLLVFYSCADKYAGFKKVDQGLYLKLLSFDESVSSADSCFTIEIEVHSPDSDMYHQLKVKQPDNLPPWLIRGDERLEKLQPYLEHLQPGDHAVFLDETTDENSPSEFSLWWKNCFSEKEFNSMYIDWLRNRELREGHRIRLFALERGFISSIVQPEVLFRTEKSGEGEPLNYGDEIIIQYTGHFLDGSIFDRIQEPLQFVLGTEGQVLDGVEFGLIGARPGEERSIVSPSFFAFGEKGSAGIVPPFTPVWYQVQIVSADTTSSR